MDKSSDNPVGPFVLIILTLLCCLILLEFCYVRSILSHPIPGERVAVYTIADPAGDWGFPSPFGHYPRGPGYVRMSLCFDALVWKEVLWHDRKAFSSKDVVFTFEYVKDHPYKWMDPKMIKKILALDDHTVKISLNAPYAPFLHNIAGTMPIAYMEGNKRYLSIPDPGGPISID